MIGSAKHRAAELQSLLPAAEKTGGGALCLLVPAIGFYAVLLTMAGSTGLFAPVTYGLDFNSMLLHLLRGRFDVDPAAIGYEGYLRDGAVYSYFGILPALLRAPFLLLPDFASTDFTRLSCLVAVSLMALLKLVSALVVWRTAATNGRPVMLSLLVAAILLSGPQVQFLRPSIYQEVLLWQGVFAAAFVLLVLHGWTRPLGLTAGLMSALAVDAGLCLLTGASTALGLYVALGLLWLWRAWQATHGGRDWRNLGYLWVAPLVLVVFAAATAFVNLERWGNPFVFVDLSRGMMAGPPPPADANPLGDYGAFNPIRLPFGLIYYFAPVWVLHDSLGQLWWQHFVEHTMIDVELPPSSFLLSDPLIVGLAIYAVVRLSRGTAVPLRAPIVLTALGLSIPAVLMLTAFAMTFRYRMEFYPLFELGAFVGFRCLLAAPPRRTAMAAFAAGAARQHRCRAPALAGLHAVAVRNRRGPPRKAERRQLLRMPAASLRHARRRPARPAVRLTRLRCRLPAAPPRPANASPGSRGG